MTLKDIKQESDKESLNKYTDELELNEKHLSLIYDTVSDAVFLLAVEPDDRFRFVSVNRAFLDITGLSREQVVGKRIEDVLPETAHALVINKYKEAINENKTVFWEQVFTYPTGERVGAVTVTPVWNAGGVCTHLVGTVHDLTERKQAKEALQKSEQMFNIPVDDLPFMIFVNQGGKVVYANETCHDLMGYTVKEFLSPDFDFLSLISAESLELIKNELSKHMQGKEVEPCEYTLVTKYGKRLYGMITTQPIDYEGESAIFGSIIDITKRKLAEEAIRESEKKFRLLAENSIDCIWILDTRLKFTYLSPSTERILGYKPEQMVGTRLSSHFKKKEFLKIGAMAAKAIKNYKTFTYVTFETKMLNSKNEEVNLEITSKMLLNSQGKLIGLQGTTRDITGRKQAEEELQERMNELETFYRTTLGREGRVIELKQEVNELLEQLGKNKKYGDYS
jgi:PAS domain S-box-containing protein